MMTENPQEPLMPNEATRGAPDSTAAPAGEVGPLVTPAGGSDATQSGIESEASGATTMPVTAGDVVIDVTEGDEKAQELSKETLLPVSGMVRLSQREVDIIDHPAFQRLFGIYQLGQTHLVYRGATHMRGEHAIGSLQMAMIMIEATKRNAARETVLRNEHWQRGEPLSEEEIALIRLGALLHDIGHLPAGHTLEDELGLLSRHDGDERITMILDRTDWHGRTYPSLRTLIDERYATEAMRASRPGDDDVNLTPSTLLLRMISQDQHDSAAPNPAFRIGVCRDLIGNTICADLLDYLHRDWLHLGKPRYFDPRVLDYLEIVTRERRGLGREDRLIINLKGTPRPRPDAVTAILDLLESRYQLAEIALFHRVKLSAAAMLERALAEYRDMFSYPRDQREALAALVPELLECSDVEMLKLLERKLGEGRTESNTRRVAGAIDLVRRLRVRRLHRDLHILYEDDIGGPEPATAIAARFSGDPSLDGDDARVDLGRAADDRLKALRALEADFGLSPGEIVMYCPPLQMNTKIAEVGIYMKGIVDSLAALDERNRRISGGHLTAQQERFRRLWRISFAIDNHAYHRLETAKVLGPLRKAIEAAVLWVPTSYDTTAHDAVREIAEDMVGLDASPWFGHSVVEPALNRNQPSVEYPGGAPSVSSFIAPTRKTAKRSRSR